MLPHHSRITKYFFLALVIVILMYAYYEARNMIYGPQIVLADNAGAVTVHEELVEIRGAVKNVVEITLSDRPVFIDDEGNFTEKLLLAPGLNRFVFEARDKFDRTKREVLEVVYEPEPGTHRSLNIDTIEDEDSLESNQ